MRELLKVLREMLSEEGDIEYHNALESCIKIVGEREFLLKDAESLSDLLKKKDEFIKKQSQQKTVTRAEIENAVGDTSDEYTEGVVELFESKGFEVIG